MDLFILKTFVEHIKPVKKKSAKRKHPKFYTSDKKKKQQIKN